MLNFKLKNYLFLLILIIFLVNISGCSRDPLGTYDDNGKPNKINFMIAKCFLNHPVGGQLPSCYGHEILSKDSNIDIVNVSEYGIKTTFFTNYVRTGSNKFYTLRKSYAVNYTINPNGNVVALVDNNDYPFWKQIEFSRRADGYYARHLPLDCSVSEKKMRECEKQVEGPDAGFIKISIVRNPVAEQSLNLLKN